MDSSPLQVRRLRSQDEEGQGPPRSPVNEPLRQQWHGPTLVLQAGKSLLAQWTRHFCSCHMCHMSHCGSPTGDVEIFGEKAQGRVLLLD